MAFATDPQVVAEQARLVAAAWSPEGAPLAWRLTAAQLEALADDEELLAIAAQIPPDRVPALLFEAAATFLVLELEPEPLRGWFPRVGEPQPALDRRFRREYRDFILDHRERLLELCARHRYQMNEVGRCADVVPALAPAVAEGRDVVLIDIGTGAGLGLHLDRYRYVYRGPGERRESVGDPGSPLTIETEVRGGVAPPLPPALPEVVDRVGIDAEPLDISDPGVRAWLAACVPQEIGAVTRFHRAAEIATANPARTVRGDACEVLPDVLDGIPAGHLACLVDSYVHVFFPPEELERFRALIDRAGRRRELDWISIDPLVPMGPTAAHSVLGVPVPAALVERNRREGVFGVLGRLGYRGGRRRRALLALAHPGAAWLEWLTPADSSAGPAA
ncbi:MAG: DUF2332 family protein [Solirubrobacterales bacterium]|nr:DUF2332 family protein [Solirubrobacterales bacterium]